MLDGNYSALWIIWGALFFAIEGPALANKKYGDTLSEHIWKWIGKKGYQKPVGYKWRRASLALFFVWLIAHLFTGKL